MLVINAPEDKENDSDESDEDMKEAAGNGKKSRKRKKPEREDHNPHVKSGRMYRSRRAGGDVKRKGQKDPHAFVPLSTQLMNPRKVGKPYYHEQVFM